MDVEPRFKRPSRYRQGTTVPRTEPCSSIRVKGPEKSIAMPKRKPKKTPPRWQTSRTSSLTSSVRVVQAATDSDGRFALRIVDERGAWKRLLIGEAAFPPPKCLDTVYSLAVRDEYFPTTMIKTSDGHEAVAAIVPFGSATHQVTLIAAPVTEAGRQLSVGIGPPQPKQTRVPPSSEPDGATAPRTSLPKRRRAR